MNAGRNGLERKETNNVLHNRLFLNNIYYNSNDIGDIMQLRKFLNKKTPKKHKLRILNKMLEIAKANGGTISVKRAREVIKNATSN